MLSPRPAEFSDGASVSHRPDGAGISRSNAYQGFTLGYFLSSLGRICTECLAIPYLKLLEVRDGGDGRPIL